MNTVDFTYLTQHPQGIKASQTEELEGIIANFPYFQSARALYLNGLKNQNSFKYNQTLKITAAYTTDRSILFDFVTASNFIENKKEPIEIISEKIDVIDTGIIETIHQKIASTFSEKKAPIEVLEIGKPLDFNSNESHSFGKWLQLNTLKPIDRETPVKNKSSKFDLIDKFIASKPKITPVKKESKNISIAKQETIDYSSLMTETLAKVYLEQKKYENAIKAYRILSLKYPEKSSLFAKRIKAIKKLDKK